MREQSHRLVRPRPVLAAGVLCSPRACSGPPDRARRPGRHALRARAGRRADARGPTRPRRRTACARSRRRTRALVLRYPTSGYADNALWQAAGLCCDWRSSVAPTAADRERAPSGCCSGSSRNTRRARSSSSVDGALQTLGQRPQPPRRRRALPPPAPDRRARRRRLRPCRRRAGLGGQRPCVQGITARVLPHGERITIEFSQRSARSRAIASTNPDRVFFDFAQRDGARVARRSRRRRSSGTLVKALRVGAASEQA